MVRLARALFGLVLFAALLMQTGSTPAADEGGGEKIYQRALRSMVWILTPVEDGALSGSGSLIDLNRRLILTNQHVVANQDKVVVLFPAFKSGKLIAEKTYYRDQIKAGNFIEGKVVFRDGKRDLAVIQLEGVPKGALALTLAGKSVSPGQKVHSVGNPSSSGALWVYTSGTVRQVYHKTWKVKSDEGIKEYEADVVETQSPTNPGDSGGPLVNDKGELVAVTQGGTVNAQLVSFFVDVGEVRALLASKGLAKVATPAAKEVKGELGDDKTTASTSGAKVDVDLDKQEQLATIKLNLAKKLSEEGISVKARLEDIVKTYPKTKAAEEAKQILDKKKK